MTFSYTHLFGPVIIFILRMFYTNFRPVILASFCIPRLLSIHICYSHFGKHFGILHWICQFTKAPLLTYHNRPRSCLVTFFSTTTLDNTSEIYTESVILQNSIFVKLHQPLWTTLYSCHYRTQFVPGDIISTRTLDNTLEFYTGSVILQNNTFVESHHHFGQHFGELSLQNN